MRISQLVTVDKSFFAEKAGQLNPQVMKEVDEGIRLSLSL